MFLFDVKRPFLRGVKYVLYDTQEHLARLG